MILPTLPNSISRRHFAFSAGISSLSVALNALISQEGSYGNSYPNTGTAKSIIFLFMSGGPSQVDTFDPKPTLRDLEGQDVPESIAESVPRIKRAGLKNLLPSPWGFRKCGESGVEVSDLLPHVSEMIDELCVIRSMTHRNPVHGPGECVA